MCDMIVLRTVCFVPLGQNMFFPSLSGHSHNFVTVLVEVFPNPYTAVILQNIVFISLTK